MKPPAFWYQPRGAGANLLAPLGLLWRAGAKIRREFAKPYRPQKPLICIGNIVVGGAGKTPTAMAVANLLLQQGQKPVFVMRGYGGHVKGPMQVDPESHSARDVGDEALLLSCVAPVWIGRDRAATIRVAEKNATHIILDDGLQNPHVAPHVSFLVIDGATGLGNGGVMPAGPLRETLGEALRRVAAVILIGNKDIHNIARRVKKPVLRARIKPNLGDDFPHTGKFVAFAGIGRPEKFYATCAEIGLHLIDWEDFPDHHMFSKRELTELQRKADEQGARLLTTEKDYVRLPVEFRSKILALPVKLVFDDEGAVKKLLTLPR